MAITLARIELIDQIDKLMTRLISIRDIDEQRTAVNLFWKERRYIFLERFV